MTEKRKETSQSSKRMLYTKEEIEMATGLPVEAFTHPELIDKVIAALETVNEETQRAIAERQAVIEALQFRIADLEKDNEEAKKVTEEMKRIIEALESCLAELLRRLDQWKLDQSYIRKSSFALKSLTRWISTLLYSLCPKYRQDPRPETRFASHMIFFHIRCIALSFFIVAYYIRLASLRAPSAGFCLMSF